MGATPLPVTSIAEQARIIIAEHLWAATVWRKAAVREATLELPLIDCPAIAVGELLSALELRFGILIEVDDVLPGLTVRGLMLLTQARVRARMATSPPCELVSLQDHRARRAQAASAAPQEPGAPNPVGAQDGGDYLLRPEFIQRPPQAVALPAALPVYEHPDDRRARHRRLLGLLISASLAGGVLGALAFTLVRYGFL